MKTNLLAKNASVIMMIAFIAMIVIICPRSVEAQTRDFKKTYYYAKEILDQQLTLEEIVMKLMQIKHAISNRTYVDVPINLPPKVDRTTVINFLCLLRLVEIHSDRCMHARVEISNGDMHRSNYIELQGILLRIFPNQTIQNLINQYASAQYFICHQGLVSHLYQRWNKLIQIHPHMIQFKDILLANFPADMIPHLLTKEQKLNGILQFLKQYSMIDYKVAGNRQMAEAYAKFKFQDCYSNIENIFHTLMMTYAKSRRLADNVKKHHEKLIKLYDLCTSLPNTIRELGYKKHRSKPIKQIPDDPTDLTQWTNQEISSLDNEQLKSGIKRMRMPRKKRKQDLLTQKALQEIMDVKNNVNILDSSYLDESPDKTVNIDGCDNQTNEEDRCSDNPIDLITRYSPSATNQEDSQDNESPD